MKVFTIGFLLVFTCFATAGVLPLQTHQSVDVLDLDLILTDANGMSLYTFTPDKPDVSTCTGSCIKAWPAVVLSDDEASKIASSTALGIFVRDDGKKQLTLNHRPLYYYRGDDVAGDRNGEGLGGVWFLLKPHFGD